ncbi:MAG: hypothetical protein ACP5IL_07195 [Syntrophobacteraceae bacterium]
MLYKVAGLFDHIHQPVSVFKQAGGKSRLPRDSFSATAVPAGRFRRCFGSAPFLLLLGQVPGLAAAILLVAEPCAASASLMLSHSLHASFEALPMRGIVISALQMGWLVAASLTVGL